MSTIDYDAIVVGAGHNGLIVATYLARSGLRVLVLEARQSVGGCSSTERFGGCLVNICNCDHITFRTTPIMDELGLADLGLRYVNIDPSQVNVPWSGGPAWAIFHSIDRTLEIIANTYPSQVDGYRRYCEDAVPVAQLVLRAAASGPRRSDLIRIAGTSGSGAVTRLLRWSRMSAADVMRNYFSQEELITPAMATGPIVWGLSPEMPGTGLGALTYAIRHVADVGRPIGGSGRLAETLAERLRILGGTIRTSSPVDRILVEDSSVRGVVLVDGEEIRSRIVVSAADPRRTFLEWLKEPPRRAKRLVARWRNQPHQHGYESKIDAVIGTLPEYRQVDIDLFDQMGSTPQGASTMITPSLTEMHEAFLALDRGEVAPRPVMFANVPSHHDPSMLLGSSGHVFSLETLFTPYTLRGGWKSSQEPRRWLELHDSLLTKSLLTETSTWRAMTPDLYESEFHLPLGHATSFAGGPIAAFRGSPSELTRYRTPIGGLYLCGAATFPGAGIWGASGRHCAREILGEL